MRPRCGTKRGDLRTSSTSECQKAASIASSQRRTTAPSWRVPPALLRRLHGAFSPNNQNPKSIFAVEFPPRAPFRFVPVWFRVSDHDTSHHCAVVARPCLPKRLREKGARRSFFGFISEPGREG